MQKVRVLIVRFTNIIQKKEIPLLRGAIIHSLGEDKDILFHNHEETKLRYSYPLIQYKRINQKAALVCVNEGADAVGKLFAASNLNLRLGDRGVTLDIDSVKADNCTLQTWNTEFYYTIRKWLPLNQENYDHYSKLEGIGEKCIFLEKILIGNILSFSKSVGIFFENEVTCKILEINDPVDQIYKGVKMLSFDVRFKSNVSIPDYIGLGKGASINQGTVTQIKSQKNQHSD